MTSTGTGTPITRQWETALRTYPDESLMFTANLSTHVSLLVDVKQIESTGIAIVNFDLLARYHLTESESGESLHDQDIRSQGGAVPSETFAGTVRSGIALVRAIKENIQTFLDSFKEQTPQINDRIQDR